jgi:hypothetical protein
MDGKIRLLGAGPDFSVPDPQDALVAHRQATRGGGENTARPKAGPASAEKSTSPQVGTVGRCAKILP